MSEEQSKEKALHKIVREWEEGVPKWARYTISEGYDPFQDNYVNRLDRMFKPRPQEKVLDRIAKEAIPAECRDEVFLTAGGVPGYLAYTGTPVARVFGHGPTERCHRWEVRETLAGFEIHDVGFRRGLRLDGVWHEISRENWQTYQGRSEAIEAITVHERSYQEAVADDLEEQRDRARIEAGFELARDPETSGRRTMSEEPPRPVGFIGKDILAIPASDDREQLAAEFRAAVEVAKLERVLPEARSCDWCGIDLYTIDDHKTVDRQYMCHPCHLGFFPEQQNTQYPGLER
jgi:hypothetical protein